MVRETHSWHCTATPLQPQSFTVQSSGTPAAGCHRNPPERIDVKKHLKPTPAARRKIEFRYYDLKKNWRKVKPHLSDPLLNYILVHDVDKFTREELGKPFTAGKYPADFDCQWWRTRHKGRTIRFHPFMNYVLDDASHWLVNFTLRLAMLVEPDREWRIITSQEHSTVWDGRDTLFDFNLQAFGASPLSCYFAASDDELSPGEYL